MPSKCTSDYIRRTSSENPADNRDALFPQNLKIDINISPKKVFPIREQCPENENTKFPPGSQK
jgi:hypothetical protein